MLHRTCSSARSSICKGYYVSLHVAATRAHTKPSFTWRVVDKDFECYFAVFHGIRKLFTAGSLKLSWTRPVSPPTFSIAFRFCRSSLAWSRISAHFSHNSKYFKIDSTIYRIDETMRVLNRSSFEPFNSMLWCSSKVLENSMEFVSIVFWIFSSHCSFGRFHEHSSNTFGIFVLSKLIAFGLEASCSIFQLDMVSISKFKG